MSKKTRAASAAPAPSVDASSDRPPILPVIGAPIVVRHEGRDFPGVVTSVEDEGVGAVRFHAWSHGHSVLSPAAYTFDASEEPAEKTWRYNDYPWGPGNVARPSADDPGPGDDAGNGSGDSDS